MTVETKGKKINLTKEKVKEIRNLIKQTKESIKKLEEEMRE